MVDAFAARLDRLLRHGPGAALDALADELRAALWRMQHLTDLYHFEMRGRHFPPSDEFSPVLQSQCLRLESMYWRARHAAMAAPKMRLAPSLGHGLLPRALAAPPDGGPMLAHDGASGVVVRCGPDGTSTPLPDSPRRTGGLAVLDDGRIIAGDAERNALHVLDAGGKLLWHWDAGNCQGLPPGVRTPMHIVPAQGRALVQFRNTSDTHRVWAVFTPDDTTTPATVLHDSPFFAPPAEAFGSLTPRVESELGLPLEKHLACGPLRAAIAGGCVLGFDADWNARWRIHLAETTGNTASRPSCIAAARTKRGTTLYIGDDALRRVHVLHGDCA